MSEVPDIEQLWLHLVGDFFQRHYDLDRKILTLPHSAANNGIAKNKTLPSAKGDPSTQPGLDSVLTTGTASPVVLLKAGGGGSEISANVGTA